MVKPADNNGNIPNGYGKITLKDNKTGSTTSYLVPVGKTLHAGDKSYNITAGGITINSNSMGQNQFAMLNVALKHFDNNRDGKIDGKDSNPTSNFGDEINKDKNMPREYTLMPLELNSDYDAYLNKGNGYANFSKNTYDVFYMVEIKDTKK